MKRRSMLLAAGVIIVAVLLGWYFIPKLIVNPPESESSVSESSAQSESAVQSEKAASEAEPSSNESEEISEAASLTSSQVVSDETSEVPPDGSGDEESTHESASSAVIVVSEEQVSESSSTKPEDSSTAPPEDSSAAQSEESSSAQSEESSSSPSKNEKPRVGIAWSSNFSLDKIPKNTLYYADAIEQAGGVPIYMDRATSREDAENLLSMVDALVLPGGPDIDPSYFGEKPIPQLGNVNERRDTSDFWVTKVAVERDMPVLAICRGLQVLNVVMGGSLYQDIPTQLPDALTHRDPNLKVFVDHEIAIEKSSKLYGLLGEEEMVVNSWHHQSIKAVGEGLVVTAKSKDGVVEGIELPSAHFVVGVQFHPERHIAKGAMVFLNIFEALVDKAR